MSSLIPTSDWYFTSKGEARGYIQPHSLKELWFHTGTACNLACPFCLEGSKPGDTRLDKISLEDIQHYIHEALELNVEQFSFTGGEPFVVRDFVRMLDYAAQHRPCLVLTNGTDAVLNREPAIKALVGTPYPISFRISIDYPDRNKHDAGRGQGNFDLSMRGIKMLLSLGFKVSIARQSELNEDTKKIENIYKNIFEHYGIYSELNLVSFPDFLTPNSQADVPEITENCMTTFQTESDRNNYMCAFSKMIVKENNEMKIYSCTLVDDDHRYGKTGTLKQVLDQRVMLGHHRCYSCFAFGASCSEI